MVDTNSHIACTLTDSKMRSRMKMVHEKLLIHVVDRVEFDNGQRLSFLNKPDLRTELEAFIKFENQCCSFLEFKLWESKEGNQLVLDITGPEGAKAFIAEALS